jgi:HEAT repeat protein
LLELGPEAVASARPALRRALASPEAGLYAADLLSRQQLDGKEAIPALIAGLDYRGPIVSLHSLPGEPLFVARALGRYGQEAVPALVQALPRQGAVQGLAEAGPQAKEAVPSLVELLNREDKPGKEGAFLRAWVIHALGRIGPEARSATPSLTRLLKSYAEGADIPHSGMHVGPVARALGEIGPGAKEAVPVLTALLENAPSDRLTGGLPEDDVDVAGALVRIDPDNKLALGRLNNTCKPAERPRPALEVAKAAFALARRDPKNPEHTRRLSAVMPGVRPEFRSATKGFGFDRDVERWFFYQDEVFCSDVARWLERFGPGAREAGER